MNYIAIGDIHGRFDLLELLLEKIDDAPQLAKYLPRHDWMNHFDFAKSKLIFLGDYVDRGPDSFKVIEKIKSLCEKDKAIALMGNHEHMMMDFWRGKRPREDCMWMWNGAPATIRSYGYATKQFGVGRFFENLDSTGHAEWLRSLPFYYETNEVWFSHAPVPKTRIAELNRENVLADFRHDIPALIWSYQDRRDEGKWERDHGKLSVAGHIHALFEKIVTPRIYPHIVYADTGCGCAADAPLTAIFIEDGKYVNYIQANPSELPQEKEIA